MGRNLGSFKTRVRILGLFFIQVSGHDFYLSKAERQYNAPYQSPPSISVRGDIYFKNKSDTLPPLTAGTVKSGFLVAVNPTLVENAEFVCGELNKIVVVDEELCVERASKKDDPFEIIAHRIEDETVKKIEALKIEGVGLYPEQWRFYPGGSLASQVLGFVGYKGDELVGRYGLENYYEDVLKGKKESLKTRASFAMSFFDLGKEILGTEILTGYDIVLTIEPSVQSFLEKKLADLVDDWDAEEAGGIIMNPKTGAIIAMAGKPDFNPNYYNEVEDISYFRNSLISDIFELGSVMKPFTMAAALDAGRIDQNTTYVDNGYVVLNGAKIENYDGKARGRAGIQDILNESLNTGAIFIMQQLGKKKFLDYFEDYGFREKTGIDLPAETSGDLSNLSSFRDVEFATASFGQGIAISPIEFTVAVASLANGGVLVRPYVVEKVSVDGVRDEITKPVVLKRVLKEETSKEITRMLVKVTDDALMGGTVKMDRYSVAAKTGTAQLPKEHEAGYYDDQSLHSFFGYGPAFDAEFVVFLYLKKPQGVRYASHTLTNPFMDIMSFLFNYYEVPPDR